MAKLLQEFEKIKLTLTFFKKIFCLMFTNIQQLCKIIKKGKEPILFQGSSMSCKWQKKLGAVPIYGASDPCYKGYHPVCGVVDRDQTQ